MKTYKSKSGKTYTKKQICEAIAYWEKQLKRGNYKKINESGQAIGHEFELWFDDDEDEEKAQRLYKANPYRVYFNYYFEAENSSGGGLIGAKSKQSLKKCIEEMFGDARSESGKLYKFTKPVVFSPGSASQDSIWSTPADNDIDVDAIVNNVFKGKEVGFGMLTEGADLEGDSYDEDDDSNTIIFSPDNSEPGDWHDSYYFEDTAGYDL